MFVFCPLDVVKAMDFCPSVKLIEVLKFALMSRVYISVSALRFFENI